MHIIERLAYLLIIAVLTTLMTRYQTQDNGKFCLEKGKLAKLLVSSNNNKYVTCYIGYDEKTGEVRLGNCEGPE